MPGPMAKVLTGHALSFSRFAVPTQARTLAADLLHFEASVAALLLDMDAVPAADDAASSRDTRSADRDQRRAFDSLAAAQLRAVTYQALTEACGRYSAAATVMERIHAAQQDSALAARAAAAARQAAQGHGRAARRQQAADAMRGVAAEVLTVTQRRTGGTAPDSPVAGATGDGGAACGAEARAELMRHEAAYQDALTSQLQKLVSLSDSSLFVCSAQAECVCWPEVADASSWIAGSSTTHAGSSTTHATFAPVNACLQVSCLKQQHAVMVRMCDALLYMARLGIVAELGSACSSSRSSSGGAAAALMEACASMSCEHAATLRLEPVLEHAAAEEAALRESIAALGEARACRHRWWWATQPSEPAQPPGNAPGQEPRLAPVGLVLLDMQKPSEHGASEVAAEDEEQEEQRLMRRVQQLNNRAEQHEQEAQRALLGVSWEPGGHSPQRSPQRSLSLASGLLLRPLAGPEAKAEAAGPAAATPPSPATSPPSSSRLPHPQLEHELAPLQPAVGPPPPASAADWAQVQRTGLAWDGRLLTGGPGPAPVAAQVRHEPLLATLQHVCVTEGLAEPEAARAAGVAAAAVPITAAASAYVAPGQEHPREQMASPWRSALAAPAAAADHSAASVTEEGPCSASPPMTPTSRASSLPGMGMRHVPPPLPYWLARDFPSLSSPTSAQPSSPSSSLWPSHGLDLGLGLAMQDAEPMAAFGSLPPYLGRPGQPRPPAPQLPAWEMPPDLSAHEADMLQQLWERKALHTKLAQQLCSALEGLLLQQGESCLQQQQQQARRCADGDGQAQGEAPSTLPRKWLARAKQLAAAAEPLQQQEAALAAELRRAYATCERLRVHPRSAAASARGAAERAPGRLALLLLPAPAAEPLPALALSTVPQSALHLADRIQQHTQVLQSMSWQLRRAAGKLLRPHASIKYSPPATHHQVAYPIKCSDGRMWVILA